MQSSLMHAGSCVHCEQTEAGSTGSLHKPERVCEAPARSLCFFRADFTVGAARGMVTYFGSAAFPPDASASGTRFGTVRTEQQKYAAYQSNRNETEPEEFFIHAD